MKSMIGTPAPEWSCAAYVNGENKTIGNKDFAGKWHILYWYPLDFTFVCPTEIQGFQANLENFQDDGVEVIGCSTDSYFSHKAWFEDGKTFPEKITHPVIADTAHAVTRAFGVLNEEMGVGYRATIVVDPEGIIRSYQVNDLSVGRSPDEILRTVQAFQSGGLCGADWKKGEEFVA